MYSVCVRSTMLYGGECWGPTIQDSQRLLRTDRSMIRWICGIKAKREVSSDSLLTSLGLVDITMELRAHRLRWFRHVQRSDNLHSAMDLQVSGKKKRGGQAKTWEACIKHDIKRCHLKDVDPNMRDLWRRSSVRCSCGTG